MTAETARGCMGLGFFLVLVAVLAFVGGVFTKEGEFLLWIPLGFGLVGVFMPVFALVFRTLVNARARRNHNRLEREVATQLERSDSAQAFQSSWTRRVARFSVAVLLLLGSAGALAWYTDRARRTQEAEEVALANALKSDNVQDLEALVVEHWSSPSIGQALGRITRLVHNWDALSASCKRIQDAWAAEWDRNLPAGKRAVFVSTLHQFCQEPPEEPVFVPLESIVPNWREECSHYVDREGRHAGEFIWCRNHGYLPCTPSSDGGYACRTGTRRSRYFPRDGR